MNAANDQNRYIFGITGTVKEIVYPSKAILAFKFNGKEEKAILLVHKYLIDGAAVDEQKLMSDILKVGDVVEFDGHIYDKGGFGQGKDKCNYYAMRAWKASDSKVAAKEHMIGGKSVRPSTIEGTGFISEVFPRKGVLVFERDGAEERVLFLASKFYIFEKRLGTKQSLESVLNEGDPVQFEAMPQNAQDNQHFCSWFASLVWKGQKPFDESLIGTSVPPPVGISGRRGSIGSTGSSESISTEGSAGSDSLLNTNLSLSKQMSSCALQDQVVRGRGFVARIVSDKSLLIWWCRQPNYLQSVWFQSQQSIFSNKDLGNIFKEGDAVKFVCSKSSSGPTQWMANEIYLDTESTI